MNNTNLIKETRDEINLRQERLKENKINAIPYSAFPNLSQYLPGITKEFFSVITTTSGAGKTLVDQALHIKGPYDYYRKYHKIKDFDIKIFSYCLEDSAKQTHKRMIMRELYDRYGQSIGMFSLDGVIEGDIMDDETKRRIFSLDKHFEDFYSKVELIDNCNNPYGIYKHVEDWLLKPENGSIVDKHGNKLTPKEIKEANEAHAEVFYKPVNPNLFVIVSIDNASCVTTEKGVATKWEALDLLCRVYLRKKLVNFYKIFVNIIFQQDKSKEKTIYKSSGDIVESSYIPSLDGIGIYKNVDNSAHLVFSLFDANRYKIESYDPGGGAYDITRLGPYYRNLSILKSNFAMIGLNTSLWFNGMCGHVEELPRASEPHLLEPFYLKAEALKKLKSNLKPLKI